MVRNTVAAFMVEKKECLDNLEEICEIPGVDMVQFGPSDYSMSLAGTPEPMLMSIKQLSVK